MISEGLHVSPGAETLSAVAVGAVLATVGGFIATQLEGFIRRRERERSAALLFGEILTVIELIAGLADQARGRGDPYGSFTLRLLRAVRRETDAYDRNREALYDLRDAKIRAGVHTVMVRLSLSLDGFDDANTQIATLEAGVMAFAPGDPAIDDALRRLEALTESRQASFDFAIETVGRIKSILAQLQSVAKQPFDAHASVANSL